MLPARPRPPSSMEKKNKKKSTMDQNLEDTIIKLASIGLEWVLLVRFLLFPDHLFLGCLLGFFFLLLGFFFRDASRDWSGQGGKWTTMNFHCERRYKRQYSLVFIGDLFRGCCWELFFFWREGRGRGSVHQPTRPLGAASSRIE